MTTPLLYADESRLGSDLTQRQELERFSAIATTQHMLMTKEIPWDIYMTARLISDRDLQLLRRYDKKDPEQRRSLLQGGGALYASALMSVLQNVTKEETVQYVLALIDDMMEIEAESATYFHDMKEAVKEEYGEGVAVPDASGILLRLLQRDDWFTQEKSAGILSRVLECRQGKEELELVVDMDGSVSESDGDVKTIVSFVDWILSQMRRPAHPSHAVPTAVHCLSVLLREKPVRRLVCRAGGVALVMPLVGMPNGSRSIQVQYESILCVWQLSFFAPASAILSTPALVAGLVDVIRLAQKEKVVRIALMALKSLLSEKGKHVMEMAAVENGLPKAIEYRLEQHWEDPDIPELLEWLDGRLQRGILAMSSLERYRKEIMQGTLVPGPMHDSEEFWQENAEKLTEGNAVLLKALLRLLDAESDPTTLALACHDLAQFVTYYAHGKGLVSDLQGKRLVMRLMAHPDSNVQKEALLCIQKLLLSSTHLGYMEQATEV